MMGSMICSTAKAAMPYPTSARKTRRRESSAIREWNTVPRVRRDRNMGPSVSSDIAIPPPGGYALRMRADIVPGAAFPDFELTDHRGRKRKLSELQGNDPLIVVLSRGGFCP